MNIEEAIRKKEELEILIRNAVIAFHEETGVKVRDVFVQRDDAIRMLLSYGTDTKIVSCHYRVKVQVEL